MEESSIDGREDEFIIAALVKTRTVLNEYRAITPSGELPHDDVAMTRAVQTYSDITPEILLVDHDAGRHFRSSIDVYKDRGEAKIVVLTKGISYCWQRYGLVKELAHLVVDTEDSTITASVGVDAALFTAEQKVQAGLEAATSLIKKLIDPPRLSQGFKDDPDFLYLSEKVTELCAEDLLFPIDIREGYIVQLENSSDLNESHHIAVKLRLPEKVVEKLLNREHFENLMKLYNEYIFPRV